MNGVIMMVIAIVVLGGGYLFYGRYLEKKWGIDPNAKTPAYELEDGVDYVPADTNIVFGHQFASIAGAGPINGPIQAAIFGWLPVLLWILIGGVFFGAVQDFASMYASVKNKGRTIGYIIEEYIGKLGKKLFLLFCWLFCILVVAAFADVVAGTFNGFVADDAGTVSKVAANGAVATTSMLFIVEAVALGCILKYAKLNKWVNTAIAIVMLVAAVALGLYFPMYLTRETWHILIFIYILIASVAPVTIVTNAVSHARKLSMAGYTTYILGGEFKATTEAIVGDEAIESLQKYNFTKGFWGTNGVHQKLGFSTPDVKEAKVKEVAMQHCAKRYVLCDSSKFSQISCVKFGEFAKTCIITTQILDESYRQCDNIIEVK